MSSITGGSPIGERSPLNDFRRQQMSERHRFPRPSLGSIAGKKIRKEGATMDVVNLRAPKTHRERRKPRSSDYKSLFRFEEQNVEWQGVSLLPIE